MMKWGRKKKVSSSTLSTTDTTTNVNTTPSHPHLISHVIPRSWLSKFKLSSEKRTRKDVNDVKKESSCPRSTPRASLPRKNSSYYKDEDGFWRVSLGEDSMGNDMKFAVPQPYWGSCKTSAKDVATKKKVPREMLVKEKERVAKEEILQRTYQRIIEATEELHRELDEVNVYRKSVEKDLPHSTNILKNKHAFSIDFDGKSNWQELKDEKIKQVLSKNEKQRKSFHISRDVNNKVRVRSPRTPSKVETCRVKAIEDMKKAKLKKKAKEIEQEEKAVVALGSFAVVKRSCDPQQDFKESMVEMIIEKRITSAEKLEELLACYLTLNADEYHDLIVKVFRQVWCDLEQSQSSTKNN